MSEPRTMYRGLFGFQALSLWQPDSPVPAFCSCMELSSCGTYVFRKTRSLDERGWDTFREDISQYWQPTEAQALAAAAPRLRQIGERLIRQADELEQAARDEISDRPALAEAADHRGSVGRPSGGGE